MNTKKEQVKVKGDPGLGEFPRLLIIYGGNNLNRQQNAVKKYSRQRENQPFGYTGYRYDDISGTYFVQAREYKIYGGTTRSDDKITNMTFFSHGQSPTYYGFVGQGVEENQLSFAYHINDLKEEASNINFTQSDIAKLDGDAFEQTLTWFYSCNAGTNDSNGKSFAQEWSNKTGGISYGLKNGRTYYGMINMTGNIGFYIPPIGLAFTPGDFWNGAWNTKIWKDKQARKMDRSIKGYSELGSLNYPTLVCLAGDSYVLLSTGIFSRGLKKFTPESNCSVK